jgi:hypothetical protein
MDNPVRVIRKGSMHGLKHERQKTNNQDVVETMQFAIPTWGTNYRIGIVSDGCSGIPAFTRSEVGANLLTVFCLGRIQELIIGGAKPADIPLPLYHAVTGLLRNLAGMIMPANVYWPFPITFEGNEEFRNDIKANKRFLIDYLSATIHGYVDDGDTLAVFRAGDGVRIVNDEVTIIDQNDTPQYPSVSVNAPGAGFDVEVYASRDVRRLALATDGLKKMLEANQADLPGALFHGRGASSLGIQFMLNRWRKNRLFAEYLGDDCAIVTQETFWEVDDDKAAAEDG